MGVEFAINEYVIDTEWPINGPILPPLVVPSGSPSCIPWENRATLVLPCPSATAVNGDCPTQVAAEFPTIVPSPRPC